MRKNGASKYSYYERRATCVIQKPSQGSASTSVCARSGRGVGLMRSMAELPIAFMVSAKACPVTYVR
jgi:hypothetical protein